MPPRRASIGEAVEWAQRSRSRILRSVDFRAGEDSAAVSRLCDMGFPREKVISALAAAGGDENEAVTALLSG